MNTNEFEAWLSRNVKNVGKGGKRPHIDPFNKALKGSERNTRAEEYPCKDVEEYHHYSERYSQKANDDDQNDLSQSQSEERSQRSDSKSGGSSKGRLTRNLISRVVAAAIGATIIVSGYQTMQANEAKANQPSTIEEMAWDWSDNAGTGTEPGTKTGTVKLLDPDGNVIKEIQATFSTVVTDATCTGEGRITHTATIEDQGKTYTDSKYETIAPLGHAFGEGKEMILENGDVIIVFECANCHEQFTISTSVEEE